MSTKRAGAAVVTVNGVSLSQVGADYFTERVTVEESDSAADKVEVVVSNKEQRFTNEFLFLERGDLSVEMGFSDDLGVRVEASMDSPRFRYPEGGGTPRIVLAGHGGAIKLAEPEKRRIWRSLRYDEIATLIAREYGLTPVVEVTQPIYEQVSQMGESDIVFLRRLAARHGLLVYVDNGELHFHRERVEHSTATIEYADGAKNVLGGEFRARLLFGGERITATGYDKLAKRSLTSGYLDEPDELTAEQIEGGGVKRALDLVGSKRSERFVGGVAQLVNQQELDALTLGAGQAAQFVIEGSMTIYGQPAARARRVVTLSGFLNLDGDYWVSWSQHEIRRGSSYTTKLRLRRTVLGTRIRGQAVRPLLTSSFKTRRFVRGVEDVTQDSAQRGSVVIE